MVFDVDFIIPDPLGFFVGFQALLPDLIFFTPLSFSD